MEARIARLESDVANLRTNMADMTINVRSLGDKMDDMNARFDTKFDAAKQSIDDVTERLGEVKDGTLTVTVLQGGKPAAGSELVVNLPTAEEQAKATTNEAGQATFPIEPGGWVGVRAKVQETRAGTHGDKEYKEVRSYSTLTFPYLED